MTSVTLTVDLRSILRKIPQWSISGAIDCFFFYNSFLAIIVFLPDLKIVAMHLYSKLVFLKYEKVDLEDTDLRSPALHTMDIFSQTTYHQNWVILAYIGAELAGGQILPRFTGA